MRSSAYQPATASNKGTSSNKGGKGRKGKGKRQGNKYNQTPDRSSSGGNNYRAAWNRNSWADSSWDNSQSRNATPTIDATPDQPSNNNASQSSSTSSASSATGVGQSSRDSASPSVRELATHFESLAQQDAGDRSAADYLLNNAAGTDEDHILARSASSGRGGDRQENAFALSGPASGPAAAASRLVGSSSSSREAVSGQPDDDVLDRATRARSHNSAGDGSSTPRLQSTLQYQQTHPKKGPAPSDRRGAEQPARTQTQPFARTVEDREEHEREYHEQQEREDKSPTAKRPRARSGASQSQKSQSQSPLKDHIRGGDYFTKIFYKNPAATFFGFNQNAPRTPSTLGGDILDGRSPLKTLEKQLAEASGMEQNQNATAGSRTGMESPYGAFAHRSDYHSESEPEHEMFETPGIEKNLPPQSQFAAKSGNQPDDENSPRNNRSSGSREGEADQNILIARPEGIPSK
eukprot:g2039.t1